MTRRALVLGGGGVTGIAWQTGLLHGLAEAGIDLGAADRVVGTSAGSVVGAQLTTGCGLGFLYERQVQQPHLGAPTASVGRRVTAAWATALLRSRGDRDRFGRLMGAAAVRAAARGRTPGVPERLAAIAERLPVREWGEGRDLRVTAVAVDTGERVVLTRESGVALVDAVTASCAVPGVYPPVPVDGRLLMDGGAHSMTNADLASDCDRAVVVAPTDRHVGPLRGAGWTLSRRGLPHLVLAPDAAARGAIGPNALDYAARPGSARAGHAQAAAVADEVRSFWGARG